MPYYSELGIYTPSSSYTSPLLKGPYSGHSSIIASNILPPSSKQFSRSNFRGFKPHLMTISESSGVPLRRINSPKLVYHSSPKVRVPRPIKINTADIDVSVNRFKKYSPQTKPQRSGSDSKSPSPQKELKPPAEPKEAKPNTQIRRDRATIRLQTIHKDAFEKEIGVVRSWRDNFKPEELVTEGKRQKKTPGEILKEKFLIRSKSKENIPQLEIPKLTRRQSIKKTASFKDICNEITSDKTLEDLNPGQPFEVRRRQSRQLSQDDILRELQRSSSTLSVEEVQILDALLQAENEVGLYDVPPIIEEQPKSVRKKKATKKKSSEKLSIDEKKPTKQAVEAASSDSTDDNLTKIPIQRRSILKKPIRKSSSEISIPDTSFTSHSRLRKDSSLKDMVKDISQVEIEMVPAKPKALITGSIGNIEAKTRNNLKAVVEDLDIQESPKAEKKEKKFRFNVTVQEFPVKKTISVPKYELNKDSYGTVRQPNSQIPVIVSILKKRGQSQLGNDVGNGKELKKIEEPVKKKLLKSFSEVQVRNKDDNRVQKSESNENMNSTFTVKVNKAKSDEILHTNGSGKLRIVSIENSLDKLKLGKVPLKNDKAIVEKTKEINESIPKIESKINTHVSKDEAPEVDALLKTTKKDLKSDTFLSKADINKNDSTPKWADKFRKTETKSLDAPVTKTKEEIKTSNSLDLVTVNDLNQATEINSEKGILPPETSIKKEVEENTSNNNETFKKTETKPLKDNTLTKKEEIKANISIYEKSDIIKSANEMKNKIETSSLDSISKKDINKTGNKLADKYRNNETKSLDEIPVIKNNEEIKKSMSLDESSPNNLKKAIEVNNKQETSSQETASKKEFKDEPKSANRLTSIEDKITTEKKEVAKHSKILDGKTGSCLNHENETSLPETTYKKKSNEVLLASKRKDSPLKDKFTRKVDTKKGESSSASPTTLTDKDSNMKTKKDETLEQNKESSLKTKLKDLQTDQTKKEDTSKALPKSSAKLRKEEKPIKDENDNQIDFWGNQEEEKYEPPKINKLKLELKDPKAIMNEIQESHKEFGGEPESPEEKEKRIMSKRSLIQKANKNDPDLKVFEPPTPPTPEPVKEPSPEPSFVPLQSNRLSQWIHPWKKPDQSENIEIFAKPKFIRARHIPRRWRQNVESHSEESTTSEEDSSSEESENESEEESEEEQIIGAESKIGASTSSNDSGFDSGRAKNNECDVNCHKKCQRLMPNLCGINQKLVVEAIEKVRKGSIDSSRDSPGSTLTPASNPAFSLDFNDLPEEVSQSSTYQSFQRSGRITPPATTIPRFRKYCVDDFNFLKVLGKGSFGKVLLAELKGTEYYYAIKCLKKDVVLEDDDVECTLIERKVLALGTKHPYLCHLLCTFQTESHLFFVMEYLNGGDLMFHIQVERRFSEPRARFYGAEIVSGLKFLHNKGIVYRDLKLDNILLDFDGHVRIADFGMCKLQIFLDRMADTFCGTPDYMAPEIIKGQHYNQCVDWWSFGVLLYEMLLGQSPFSGCDEDELFWSICNEKPVIPRFLSAEASSVLIQFLEKDANKRLGNRFSPHGDIQDHPFFKPIDWDALENRRLEPPFKPNLQHPLDTQYFDKTFTTEKAKLTPIEAGILQSMDQTQFQGFSYTNPNATDK